MKNRRGMIIASMGLLLLAIGIETKNVFSKEDFDLKLEYINTKDIASNAVSKKIDSVDTSSLVTNIGYDVKQTVKKEKIVEQDIPDLNKEEKKQQVMKLTWRLPTEVGTITQYPSYYHAAYDITSPRGYGEIIYPVADGTISSIYYDNAGALIVTILHEETGKKYTSQYVHMSRFGNIHVGQKVDTNTIIGYMGATGIATGVHLHITIADCALYQDQSCPTISDFHNYSKQRVSQGYVGLGNQVYVPYSWNSR